jgi:hypothetical protein
MSQAQELPQPRSWYAAYRLYRQNDGKMMAFCLKLSAVLVGINIFAQRVPYVGPLDDTLLIPEVAFFALFIFAMRHQLKQFR